MDEQSTMKWVDEVRGPYTKDSLRGGRETYLLKDEFSMHLMESVNNQINNLGTEVDIIPGEYTGSVQVLDKGVNKPFKGYLRDQFEEWMFTNGSRRWPSRAEVAQWVAKAWERVTTVTIVNTWKSIGHKVADDDDEENIVANQPGAGQESTGDDEDDEAEDFIIYQVADEREAPYTLLQNNFDNNEDDEPFIMDLPEEERQQARNFHNGFGFTAV
jgi:hypothetical protein